MKEDAFQAQVCLAWLHITIGQVAQALSTVPNGLEQASERFHRDGGVTERWTHVCIIKGAYLRGASLACCMRLSFWLKHSGYSLEQEGKTRDAYQVYESMLPYISNLPSTFARTTQHHYWREMVLARYCMLSSSYVLAHAESPSDLLSPAASIPSASLLTSFRAYAHNWDAELAARANRSSFSLAPWQAYYNVLSILVQHGIVEPMFDSKLQQSTELKTVETIYEDGLLKNINFPRADQTSSLVETWVDQVMANWRVMYGSTWREEEVGEGGKATLARDVLDVSPLPKETIVPVERDTKYCCDVVNLREHFWPMWILTGSPWHRFSTGQPLGLSIQRECYATSLQFTLLLLSST